MITLYRLLKWPGLGCGIFVHALGIVLLSACGGSASSGPGDKAPDFTLEELGGQEITLNQLRGQPVMLNFWATWCVPCREEMPLIEEAYHKHGEAGLEVLAINFGDSSKAAEAFATEKKLSFPVLLDEDSKVTKLYGVRGLPVSVFIDSEGTIVDRHTGALTENQLAGYLEKIVK